MNAIIIDACERCVYWQLFSFLEIICINKLAMNTLFQLNRLSIFPDGKQRLAGKQGEIIFKHFWRF